MTAGHSAFPVGARGRHIPGLAGLRAWKGPGKTQDSGFPALQFPVWGEADRWPSCCACCPRGGKEHSRPGSLCCPAMSRFGNVFRFQWFLATGGAPPLQGNWVHMGTRSNSRNERIGSRICVPTWARSFLGGLPSAGTFHQPLAPSAQAQSHSFQQRGLIPTPAPCTCLPLAARLWSHFTPFRHHTFAQMLSAQRDRPDHLAKVQPSLSTSSPLTLVYHTQPFSLPGLTDLHPSLSTHVLSPPAGPLESCSLLCPQ